MEGSRRGGGGGIRVLKIRGSGEDWRSVGKRTAAKKENEGDKRVDERENLQSQSLHQDRSILSTETFDNFEKSMLCSDSRSIWVVFGDRSSDLEEGEADVRFGEFGETFDESTEKAWS